MNGLIFSIDFQTYIFGDVKQSLKIHTSKKHSTSLIGPWYSTSKHWLSTPCITPCHLLWMLQSIFDQDDWLHLMCTHEYVLNTLWCHCLLHTVYCDICNTDNIHYYVYTQIVAVSSYSQIIIPIITVDLYIVYFVMNFNRAECASTRRRGKISDGVWRLRERERERQVTVYVIDRKWVPDGWVVCAPYVASQTQGKSRWPWSAERRCRWPIWTYRLLLIWILNL